MALDAILLSGILRELNTKLIGARIDKVSQPDRETVVLSVRNQGENMRLLINAGAGSGRIQLTAQSPENPAEPPMFCMLMRKYLVGGRIESIVQPDWERLALIKIISHNELGDTVSLSLSAELMGRSSNLVLIGSDGRIIDCLRRMDYGGDLERRMLPGMIYRLPPKQKKPLVFDCSAEEIRAAILNSDTGKSLDKRILDSFSGLSPTVCRELVHRCHGDPAGIPIAIEALAETVKAGELTPIMQLSDSKPESFSFMPLSQYGSILTEQSFDSFCELLDAYYSKKELIERRKKRSRELSHSVKTARDRIARKLSNQQEELKRTELREEVRKAAELLTANLYRIKKGERSVRVLDYYSEDQSELEIKLDPLKNPQQNAAHMFKEYNKQKTANVYLKKLISEGEKQLDYLNSVLSELERAENEADIADIKRELQETGYIKKQKNEKQKKPQKQGYLHFVSSDGFNIYVGRSNTQNDELTTKTARRTDYWLHTKSVHGSHVIISCEGLEPPEKTICEAAAIAAYYSQAREGGRAAVDITLVKNVRKPAGALPGKVIYTDYRSMIAESDESIVESLKKR